MIASFSVVLWCLLYAVKSACCILFTRFTGLYFLSLKWERLGEWSVRGQAGSVRKARLCSEWISSSRWFMCLLKMPFGLLRTFSAFMI